MPDDGWISVEDALPIDDDEVLVYCPEAVHNDESPYCVDFLCKMIFGRKQFIKKWNITYAVTHWQPLPGPPVIRPAGGPAASDA